MPNEWPDVLTGLFCYDVKYNHLAKPKNGAPDFITIITFFLFWVDVPELRSCLCFTERGLPFVFAPKNPSPQTTRSFALVCLWCGRTVGRLVSGQVIAKFSRMGSLPQFFNLHVYKAYHHTSDTLRGQSPKKWGRRVSCDSTLENFHIPHLSVNCFLVEHIFPEVGRFVHLLLLLQTAKALVRRFNSYTRKWKLRSNPHKQLRDQRAYALNASFFISWGDGNLAFLYQLA